MRQKKILLLSLVSGLLSLSLESHSFAAGGISSEARFLSSTSDSISCTQGSTPWGDNVTQFGGTNVSTGTGIGGAGIPRVTVSSDSSLTCNAGTNLNTSLLATSANQSTEITQLTAINANTDTLETLTGAVTETAPASDTASSGLNGRLQRLAQRITTLIGSTLTVQGPSGTPGTPSGGIITAQGTNLGQPFPSSLIDAANSTATILTANSTFTGTFVDVSSYSNLNIILFTDQVSATDGLKVEYSTDGTNVDDNDLFTIPASNGQQLTFPLPAKYYRVRYVNGATNQGVFRMQAKLSVSRSKPSSQRIGTLPNFEQDAEVVIAAPSRISLTASTSTFATVGTASATAVAANTNRKGLVLTNTSTHTISFSLGGTAVLNSGITLYPGGVWVMTDFTFTTGAIAAIAGAASSNLAIEELTQ